MEQKMMTAAEFSKATGISRNTLRTWTSKNKLIPAQHNPKGVPSYYSADQIEDALRLAAKNNTKANVPPENDTNHNDTQIVPTDETSPVTLDQRADKIRRLQADVQRGMIEIGLELIAAKAEIGHGKWTAWLEMEFDWTDRTARYFMAVAERFGNRNTYSDLKPSPLKAMLTLPEGDEQAFIDAQAEAGKPVAEQSAREVQKNVKAWTEQRRPKQKHVEESIGADNQSDNDTQPGTPRNIENLMGVIQPETISTSEDTVSNDDAQIDDDTGKLIVGDKPLDSCQGFVCIEDDETDETPQRPADDDDLRKAQAQAQTALEAVSAAIMQTSDRDALQAVTVALNAIRDQLEAPACHGDKRKDACLDYPREV